MLAWWNDLTLFQMIMVCIATPATLIIIIQMVLLLIGFGGDESFDTADGMDGGVDSVDIDTINSEGFLSFGGIRVFTLRGILSFLCVGGWLAMALDYTLPGWLAGLIGLLGGLLTAVILAVAFHYALKMQSSGNINYKYAVNHIATVYLRIPPKRTGTGKINLTLQERYTEINAVTDDEDFISTGLPVKIIALADSNTVIVKRYNKNKEKTITSEKEQYND
ncbi:MAG: hypothetical protein PHE12_04785 [Clostridia bacterium]|nr:hypothetical protein [Clostridia bacterium]